MPHKVTLFLRLNQSEARRSVKVDEKGLPENPQEANELLQEPLREMWMQVRKREDEPQEVALKLDINGVKVRHSLHYAPYQTYHEEDFVEDILLGRVDHMRREIERTSE